jgi:RNA polymerase sigma factor for flagellar operon FliA
MASNFPSSSNDFAGKVSTIRLRAHNFLRQGKLRELSKPRVKAEAPGFTFVEAHDASLDRKVVELYPLLQRIARKMRARLPAHIEVDDLVGAGALGLLDAVRKFDVRKQVKIESYAQHRIRGAILDSLRNMDGASRDLRKKSKKAEKIHRELEAKLGHPASDQDMAQAQGLSLKKWYRTVRELQPLGVEWLRPMGSVGVKQLTEETLVSEGKANQFDLCYRGEQLGILNRAMAVLSGREQLIIALYYDREFNMKQIGVKLGIDESRVSQLHSAALVRLRNNVTALLRRSQMTFVPACVSNDLDAA